MVVDFLVIGQGIAGTLISAELIRKGKSFIVIDQPTVHQSSSVAGAVLNPVVLKGRKRERFLPETFETALEIYRQIEQLLDSHLMYDSSLFVFTETETEFSEYQERIAAGEHFLSIPSSGTFNLHEFFNTESGILSVHPVWYLNAVALLNQWKDFLQQQGAFIESEFEYAHLVITSDLIAYKNIQAKKIIFCEGANGISNPFFVQQKFVANRGDVLILEIPGLRGDLIYQRIYRLIPRGNDLFWFGSNFQWKFTDILPDREWRNLAEAELTAWLKLPWKVKDHLVAERPTTPGQVPIHFIHPENKCMAMFNGLGTKGFTIGPSLARDLVLRML